MENKAGLQSILVVEDEPVIAHLCQRILTSEGFEVTLAADARIARDLIIERPFDLYLVDILTPVMNGRELYQWLKEEKPQQIDRVIFTSGIILDEVLLAFLAESGVPFLVKPFTRTDIVTIVRERYQQLNR